MLFKKKEPKIITIDGKNIELQPKPKMGIMSVFGSREAKPQTRSQAQQHQAKPQAPAPQQAKPEPKKGIMSFFAGKGAKPRSAAQPSQVRPQATPPIQPSPQQQRAVSPAQLAPTPLPAQRAPAQPMHAQKPAQKGKAQFNVPAFWHHYVEKTANRNRKIEPQLMQRRMKESLYDFVQRMLIASIVVALVMGATFLLVLLRIGMSLPISIVLFALVAFAINRFAFTSLLRYPLRTEEIAAKNIERDILFAARDIIISLRSGMPLYNAIVSVSTGYGDASREFAKITERSQLGMSLEDAIDQTISESKSQSFRRVMLQASASIKAGADIVASLQSVVDQLSQERMILLRRYGQRLNAIAMFYMLFGVILPSMGIAIATILTTFISVFTVNDALLEAAIVGILFLQVIFLQMIRGSRPAFAT